jgi:hypothetical protein
MYILGFVISLKNDYCFFFNLFIMFITICHKKILCSCKGHQDAMWHHGFVIIINRKIIQIFGIYVYILMI